MHTCSMRKKRMDMQLTLFALLFVFEFAGNSEVAAVLRIALSELPSLTGFSKERTATGK